MSAFSASARIAVSALDIMAPAPATITGRFAARMASTAFLICAGSAAGRCGGTRAYSGSTAASKTSSAKSVTLPVLPVTSTCTGRHGPDAASRNAWRITRGNCSGVSTRSEERTKAEYIGSCGNS